MFGVVGVLCILNKSRLSVRLVVLTERSVKTFNFNIKNGSLKQVKRDLLYRLRQYCKYSKDFNEMSKILNKDYKFVEDLINDFNYNLYYMPYLNNKNRYNIDMEVIYG